MSNVYDGNNHGVAFGYDGHYTLIVKDHLGDWSPGEGLLLLTDVLTTRAQAFFRVKYYHLTLKMACTKVVETSVNNNSPSQDSNHPDGLFQSRYVTPGFKPFSYIDM